MRNENEAFDKAFDMLLTEAAIMADENIGKKLEEPEEEIVFSAAHNEKMRKIFQRERRKRLLASASKWSKRCACILLVIVSVASVSVMSVDAWRSKVMSFIFDPKAPNTDFSFNAESYSDSKISIGYIPENFNLTYYDDENGMALSFENGDLYFDIHIDSAEGSVGIDTEDAVIEELTIQGYKAIYSSNKRVNILLWNDEKDVYTICGNIDKEDMLKIGESIKY